MNNPAAFLGLLGTLEARATAATRDLVSVALLAWLYGEFGGEAPDAGDPQAIRVEQVVAMGRGLREIAGG